MNLNLDEALDSSSTKWGCRHRVYAALHEASNLDFGDKKGMKGD
jgi:hypothetical protein